MARLGRLSFIDDPETGWLARLMGTALLVASIATAQPGAGGVWLWPAAAVVLAGWLAFALLHAWAPRGTAAGLAASALVAAVATGPSRDGTALILMLVPLAMFAALTTFRLPAILAVGVAAMVLSTGGELAWGRPPGTALGHLAIIAIIVLLGLYRRQYRSQVRQTELLLEQTRQAQQERARAAALDERTRIARELHDVLAHSLGALLVQLDVAEGLLAERHDPERALARVRRSRALAAEGLDEARRAVAALRDDVPPLGVALAELVGAFRQDHDATVEFGTAGTPRPVSPAATVSLLRAAREALVNAARHAPGGPVTVLLEFGDDTVRVRVDNGPPTRDGAAGPTGGFGLTGMRERLALVGGTLRTGPPAGGAGGWQVTAEVPE